MAETSGAWGLFLVIVALLLCAAAFYAGMRFAQRRRAEWLEEEPEADQALEPGGSRLAVLESTAVESGRRLVLVRCDDLEHLIMVGGQADLVVDSDVRRVRGAVRPVGATAQEPPKVAAQAAAAKPGARVGVAAAAGPPAAAQSAAPVVAEPAAGAALSQPGAPLHAPAGPSPAAPAPSAKSAAAVPPEAANAVETLRPSQPTGPAPGARGGNGASGPGRIPAEPVVQAVPSRPGPQRSGARRPFFAAAFAGGRDRRGSERGPEADAAGDTQVGGEPSPATESSSSGAPAEPVRPALAAVPVVRPEGPRAGSPGGPVPTVAAPASRPASVEALSARRDEGTPARGEVQPGRATGPQPAADPGNPSATAASEPAARVEPVSATPPTQAPAALRSEAEAESVSAPGTGATPAKPNGLPTAGIPWDDSGGLEDEIGRALRSAPPTPVKTPEPAVRGTAAVTGLTSAGRTVTDPATTLGDLAERLESALAREIATAQQNSPKPAPKQPDQGGLKLDEFAFELDAGDRRPAVEPPSAPAVPPRAAAEAEPRRERQDDAPVIDLNSRRRESVDPLEDEMARLLGELTGDTTRR